MIEDLLLVFCLETGIEAKEFLHPMNEVDAKNPVDRFGETLKMGDSLNPPNMWSYGSNSFDKVPYDCLCYYWKDGRRVSKFVNWLASKKIKNFSRNMEMNALLIKESSVKKFLSDPKVMEKVRGAFVATKVGIV